MPAILGNQAMGHAPLQRIVWRTPTAGRAEEGRGQAGPEESATVHGGLRGVSGLDEFVLARPRKFWHLVHAFQRGVVRDEILL